MTTDETLAVNELYDRLTVQGEGPSLGRVCTFIRLARCNLDCGEGDGATWACDTPFTWRWEGIYTNDRPTFNQAAEVHTMPVVRVLAHVLALRPPLVVISGGEPMLQRRGLTALVHGLWEMGSDVEIETNGTQAPWDGLAGMVNFNVSPKLSNSGIPHETAWRGEALAALPGRRDGWVFPGEHGQRRRDDDARWSPGWRFVDRASGARERVTVNGYRLRAGIGRVADVPIAGSR